MRWGLAGAIIALCWGASGALGYSEELLLQELSDASVLAHFEFSAAVPAGTQHAGTFPAALLALAQRHGVQQLELSLTQGRWAWEWQLQAAAGAAAAAAVPRPPGLELRASFGGGVHDTRAAYAALARGLGGLLCAGVATVPQLAVMAAPAVGWFAQQQPAAAAAAAEGVGGGGGRQVYAWLPQEGACVENLSAWLRLLPCRQHAGLAALLQPLQLAAAPYHSLGLQLWVVPGARPVQPAGNSSRPHQRQQRLELRQTLTAVLPPPAAGGGPQQAGVLERVFGAGAPAACPAAASSTLYLAGGAGSAAPGLVGQAARANRGGCAQHDTSAGPLLACKASHTPQQQAADATPALPPASLLRQLAVGAGAAPSSTPQARLPPQVAQHVARRGGGASTLVVGVRAAAGGEPLLLHLMQLLPWQLLPDASSLAASLDGRPLRPGAPELAWWVLDARPDRTAVLELLLRLPAAASGTSGRRWHELEVRLAYRPAFAPVFDHAPDASRGVDIPPALATLLPAACAAPAAGGGSGGGAPRAPRPLLARLGDGCLPRCGGSPGGGVAPLPLPDAAMPFNVACLTSTLLAVLLGGVANVVLRSPEELAGRGGVPSGAPAWQRKLRRAALLLALTAALAVYLDRDLQRQLDAAVQAAAHALHRTQAPELHGEL